MIVVHNVSLSNMATICVVKQLKLIERKYSMMIYIYLYIVIHRQICFVLSELISVARQYIPVAVIETRLTQTPSPSF